MPEHEDWLLARFLELLEQQQWLLVIAQTPFCNAKGFSPHTLPPQRQDSPVFPKQINMAYILQSSFILYFFNAAGNTFQHGSSSVTRNDFAAAVAEAVALADAALAVDVSPVPVFAAAAVA